MDGIKLSVIVPMYNSDAWIKRCLSSIFQQGLNDDEFEVIVVDDGSHDGSVSVVKSLQQAYPNLILLRQEHEGQGKARNHALYEARGEWVVFVDSDDTLVTMGLKFALAPHFDDSCDIIGFRYVIEGETEPVISVGVGFKGFAHDYVRENGLPKHCWNFAYRLDFLAKNKMRFHHLMVGEDSVFTAQCLLMNPQMITLNACLYRYNVKNPDRVTTKSDYDHAYRCAMDTVRCVNDLFDLVEKYSVEYNSELYNQCIDSINHHKEYMVDRFLAADVSKEQHDHVWHVCEGTGFYPIYSWSASEVVNVKVKRDNKIIKNYWAYRIYRFLRKY